MIAHWEKKLCNLKLDQDTSATEYIHSFEMYVRALTELGEYWSDAKKVREFKLNVIDEDNDTEIRVHSGDFAELRSKVRIREEFLQKRADEAKFNNKRTRRMKGADEEQETIDRNKKIPFIPLIPRFLFNTIKDQDVRTNLSKWRKMINNSESMEKVTLFLVLVGGMNLTSRPANQVKEKVPRPGG